MEGILQDLRYGARMLLKNRLITAVAVASLALGIGANVAVFSFVDRLLVRPLPVEDPSQLVTIMAVVPGARGGPNTAFNYPLYTDYRDRNEVFSGIAAYDETPFSLSAGGQNERVNGMLVSGNYFAVVGVQAALGRTFLPEEDQTPGTHPVTVISYGLWQRRFGADPNVIGQTIALNGYPFTIIGVTPAEFTGTIGGLAPDLYVPLMMTGQAMPRRRTDPLNTRFFTWLYMLGRLRPGVTVEQAQAHMRTLAEEIEKVAPDNTLTEIVLGDGSQGHNAQIRQLSGPLQMLMATVALILLIACANVANLLLARATARRQEIAIRMSLGASRGRLIRQLLTESFLLSAIGGALGILLALWIADLLTAFRPPEAVSPETLKASLDTRVLGFAVLVTFITGLVFGLAPAVQASKPDIQAALKAGSGLGGSRRRWNLRKVLVSAQVALSLVTLICAGLCVRSLQNLQNINVGFEPAKVLVMSLDVGLNGYNEAQGQQFYPQLTERVAALPGVEAVSMARIAPLGDRGMRITVNVEGNQPQPGEFLNFSFNVIGPNYFRTMGMPLLRGRDFTAQDAANAPPVVIINETIANQFWPGQEALGKHIRLDAFPGTPEKNMEVVGVVKDSKYRSLTEAATTMMYLPVAQSYSADMALHVRSAGDPRALVAAVRQQVQGLDPNLPVYQVKTLAEQRVSSLYLARLAATMLSAFGLLGMALAAIGLYGVMAYAVNNRIHEIGIRMALGAQARDVLKLILGEGMALVLIGLVLGVGGAVASSRLLIGFLYGVSAADPFTFIAVSIGLGVVALLACYVPARRATKVEPMVALKYE